MKTVERHVNTTSDSEILLNVFATELDLFPDYPLEVDNIFVAATTIHQKIRGACVGMIIGPGLFAFRDPNGIRPLVICKRMLADRCNEYSLDTLRLDFLRHRAGRGSVRYGKKKHLFTR